MVRFRWQNDSYNILVAVRWTRLVETLLVIQLVLTCVFRTVDHFVFRSPLDLGNIPIETWQLAIGATAFIAMLSPLFLLFKIDRICKGAKPKSRLRLIISHTLVFIAIGFAAWPKLHSGVLLACLFVFVTLVVGLARAVVAGQKYFYKLTIIPLKKTNEKLREFDHNSNYLFVRVPLFETKNRRVFRIRKKHCYSTS